VAAAFYSCVPKPHTHHIIFQFSATKYGAIVM
jgi:hypothetical protein